MKRKELIDKKKIKIIIFGGSNSVLTHSYTKKLQTRENFIITNCGIGATNSTYSLIQNIKNEGIKNNDYIIFEYFVNDNNHYYQNINSIEKVRDTLHYIINECIMYNKKLIFVLIYNHDHLDKYDKSPMYQLYKTTIKEFNITTIDSINICNNVNYHWIKEKQFDIFYQDPTHLNDYGMTLIENEIYNNINLNNVTIPNILNNILSTQFNNINCELIDSCDDKLNFTNSLINVNYIVGNNITIFFNTPCIVIAIEYICDIESGYITFSNNYETIQKNLLKNESFVLNKNKKMLSMITFNNILFSNESNKYMINTINPCDIYNSIYDKERNTKEYEHPQLNINYNIKLVSLLVTNNAKISNIIVK